METFPQDTKRGRHRPCKATRNQCKQLLSQMNDLYKDDPEQILGVLKKVWETSVDDGPAHLGCIILGDS